MEEEGALGPVRRELCQRTWTVFPSSGNGEPLKVFTQKSDISEWCYLDMPWWMVDLGQRLVKIQEGKSGYLWL